MTEEKVTEVCSTRFLLSCPRAVAKRRCAGSASCKFVLVVCPLSDLKALNTRDGETVNTERL